ncbi:MAG: DUF2752 domain-containing protein [Acidobacteriales bacterium]|nr:DUF2752 domain-containing protein [Terriglobales bacterium]
MTRDQIIGSGAVLVAAAICGLVLAFPPQQYSFYPVCPIYHWTGLLCPGCGATRALHALLHGELVAAFLLNPLLVLLAPGIAGLSLRQLACAIRDGNFPNLSFGNRPVFAMVAVSTVFGMIRNLL